MKYDDLANLSRKEKIDLLEETVKNDVSYWKKLLLIMNLGTEEENLEVMDKIIEHKIEEIELLKSKYNIRTDKFSISQLKDILDEKDFNKVQDEINNKKNN